MSALYTNSFHSNISLKDVRLTLVPSYFSGMISAVGISTLQFVDLNSTRNLFILGLSVFFGLSFPAWMNQNSDAIKTGMYQTSIWRRTQYSTVDDVTYR